MTDYVDAAGLQGEVALIRDSYGIPHIRAGSAADAWFAMGFACAQDRLFQMEYDRRRAAGRWAEIAGPAAVPGDVLARRMALTEAAHADLAVMSAPVREMFEAYARGVNVVIASGARPVELRDAVGRGSGTGSTVGRGSGTGSTVIEPWQPWHSVAAYKVRHILMGQWQHKLTEASVLARVGAEAFSLLDTRSPAGSTLTVPPGGRLAQVIADATADVVKTAPYLGFLAEAEPGSNAWAVSGRRTAHGGAVLCNDSHRHLDAPNVYWQCHLECPEFRVIGAAFPGVPGFPHFGHNGQVAWAITHASADTQIYLEQFDTGRPGWYRTEDGWEQAEQRTETITVRGAEPVTTQIWATRHGPVVHGDPLAGMAIALKYTATCRPGRGFEPLLPMLTARTATELVDAQRDWVDPVNNLVTADTSGAIAYQTRGELPIRSSPAHRRLPVPGWDGGCEWTGLVPFEEMPRCVNPAAGFVMTSNNAIVDGDQPFITYSFSHPFRAERLRQCLTATPQHTTAGLAALQGDMTSWAAQAWGRLLTDLPDFLEEEDSERTRRALAGWGGQLRGDSAEALLYGCFTRALAEALYRPLTGDETWAWLTSGQVPPADTIIRRWLANDIWELLGGPVPDDAASEGGAAKQQRVRDALPEALAAAWRQASELAVLPVPDPHPMAGREWRWGDVHRARAVHPLAGQAPAPVGMGGDGDTIQVGAYSWRQGTPFDVISLSVYRQVVDLAEPAAASFVIPGGACGDPASPHFADQLAEWAQHRRVPMLFDWPDVEAAAKAAAVLRPGG